VLCAVQLVRRFVSESLISTLLFVSMLLAYFSFYLPLVQSALPISDGTSCLRLTGYTAAGVAVVFIGLLIASYERSTPSQLSGSSSSGSGGAVGGTSATEIDVWAQFEALEEADAQKARERREARERAERERAEREARAKGIAPIPPRANATGGTAAGAAAAAGGGGAAKPTVAQSVQDQSDSRV
jgi:hypothetical protein